MAEDEKPDEQPDEKPDEQPDEKPDEQPDHAADAAKWKAMARKHEKQAKENKDAATRLKELEDADKSEAEKAKDDAAAAEKRATDAEAKALRYEVAAEKEIPGRLMRFMSGATREELEEQADALLEELKGEESVKPPAGGKGRPKEKLRSGASEEEDPEDNDPTALAAKVPRGGY